MKNKMPTPIKDGLTGIAMGTAVIIPGISGGTIALVLGAIDKITGAVRNLFSKSFWRNLLVLIPYFIGMLIAIAILYIPFDFALENIRFSLICLFAGLIAGSIPIITMEINPKNPTFSDCSGLIIGLIISVLIGVLSVFFNFSASITSFFSEIPSYLFIIVVAVGIISAAGLIVPGLSGSLILLVIGFYDEIFSLLKFKNGWLDFALLVCFAIGVAGGFILWSILLNRVLNKHRRGTIFVVLGFIIGSLFSIFFNSAMVGPEAWYSSEKFNLLEWILGPCLALIGFICSFLFSRYVKKHPEIRNA